MEGHPSAWPVWPSGLARVLALVVAAWLAGGVGCAQAGDSSEDEMLPPKLKKLLPLHKKLGKPGPQDWLANHPEPGETFRQYLRGSPVAATRRRRVVYVQPLGDFTDTQRKIVTLTAEHLRAYFGLPVKTREGLSLDVIPDDARRKHPSWGMDQILSTYVLSDVLHPRLPKDAMAYIALTASDLWPGEGWNFVFGQASLTHRVGVWSIYRNGDPQESDEAFRLCLARTIKTATHEIGHMFSMKHCIRFECNMCGSNHRAERDRLPLWLCPHCLAKLSWATKADAEKRFEKLIAFCEANGLTAEQEFYRKSLAVLRGQ